jgi:hypothetical protein
VTTISDLKSYWLQVQGHILDIIECPVCYTVLFTAHAQRHYTAAHPGLIFDDPVWHTSPPRPS